jgi:hypothetical protein
MADLLEHGPVRAVRDRRYRVLAGQFYRDAGERSTRPVAKIITLVATDPRLQEFG